MAIKEIKIFTPEEMAAAQNSKLDQRDGLSDGIIGAMAELIHLRILEAGYVPYIDHPKSHPKDYLTEIPLGLIRPRSYFQYLEEIFEPKGWRLLPQSRYSGECAVVVLQTVEQRREWIKKMWESFGHRLAPWNLGRYTDETHCLHEGCNLEIIFRRQMPSEYSESTEYRLGEGVWAGDFKMCPMVP